MALSNAQRQAAYRARQKEGLDPKALSDDPLDVANQRILELEEEVRHLKRQLAQSASPSTKVERRILPTVPFKLEYRPVPKVSPSRSATSGRGRAG